MILSAFYARASCKHLQNLHEFGVKIRVSESVTKRRAPRIRKAAIKLPFQTLESPWTKDRSKPSDHGCAFCSVTFDFCNHIQGQACCDVKIHYPITSVSALLNTLAWCTAQSTFSHVSLML